MEGFFLEFSRVFSDFLDNSLNKVEKSGTCLHTILQNSAFFEGKPKILELFRETRQFSLNFP